VKYVIDEIKMLEFDPRVISTFDKYKQLPGRQESGGILLGRVYENKIFVEAVTAPSYWDRAGLTFFTRNRSKAQDLVNNAWHDSEGELIYLGEWHTHSEPHPQPSTTDRTMIRKMLQESKMEIDFLVTVIVGVDDYWIGLQKGKKLRQLERCGESSKF
jgi:integrative and conjugative element protein (TIGR02256 family)